MGTLDSHAVFLLIGWCTMMIGLAVFLRAMRSQYRYMGEVLAKVQSVESVVPPPGTRGKRSYVPILSYDVNGRHYQSRGQRTASADDYVPGAILPIRYQPANPEKCLTRPSFDATPAATCVMLCGMAMVILAVVGMLF